tara:strand:- start:3672 stop:3854 length:183 start_codon:yes stop_codon:yes gene_type:complete
MIFTWLFAFFASLGLRFWGVQHPLPFLIRPSLVWILVFTPSLLIGLWVGLIGFIKIDNKF